MFNSMRNVIMLILTINLLLLCACDSAEMQEYYSEKGNYINASGTVTHIKYSENEYALYLGFSADLVPSCDGTDFKIVGANLTTVQANGIDEKIELGSKVEFITAPKYWGDGYVMPIVAITIDGEELLSFDEGYDNFMEWFDETN